MSETKVPESFKREIQRAIDAAMNRTGTVVGLPKALIPVDKAQYLLKLLDVLERKLATAAERIAELEQGISWMAECVIRERDGTPDPQGWIRRAFEMVDKRNADIAQLTRERDEARADAERVKMAGAAMSNICFNGKQCDRVPEDYRKSMAEAQERWDAAIRAMQENER